MHLLVDSTVLKLCGAGEWLHEKHGTKVRRSSWKLRLGIDAGTGQIVASLLTTKDVDDGSQVGPLLAQVQGPIASFTGDNACDQDGAATGVSDESGQSASGQVLYQVALSATWYKSRFSRAPSANPRAS